MTLNGVQTSHNCCTTDDWDDETDRQISSTEQQLCVIAVVEMHLRQLFQRKRQLCVQCTVSWIFPSLHAIKLSNCLQRDKYYQFFCTSLSFIHCISKLESHLFLTCTGDFINFIHQLHLH